MYKNAVIPAMEPESRSFNRKGFTLIELLVVVLIIGILSAVALPQYQMAVGKARIARLLPLVRTVKEAQEAYYMANGDYAIHFEDLDISIPTPNSITAGSGSWRGDRAHYGHWSIDLLSHAQRVYGSTSFANNSFSYTMLLHNGLSDFPCENLAIVSGNLAEKLARSMGGVKQQTSGSTVYYCLP
ncbi:MAG: type II secretion system protein [Elusimicrobiales bacterium]|nr:type II secretion system protein [Elusimicrobiales bacterium]